MATRTFQNGGSWNSVANWAEGAIVASQLQVVVPVGETASIRVRAVYAS